MSFLLLESVSSRIKGIAAFFSKLSLQDLWDSSSEKTHPKELQKTLRNLIFIRLVIVTVIMGAGILAGFVDGALNLNSYPLIAVVLATLVISAANLVWLYKSTLFLRIAYTQLFFDVVLASLVIYVSASPISFALLLIVVLGATTVLNSHGAVIIAAISGLAYAVLASGLLPEINGKTITNDPQGIIVVYLSLVAVALVSNYLARKIELFGKIASQHAKHLAILNTQQQQLFDDISEGIITLDLESCITSVNQAARTIIGLGEIDPKRYLGQTLVSVFNDLGLSNAKKILSLPETFTGPKEIIASTSDTNEEMRLSYTLRPLTDSEHNEIGKILVFSDVSHVRNIEERLMMHERITKMLAHKTDPDAPASSIFKEINLIGESSMMKKIFALVERVAQSDASVLITGESGTGKELVARAIHVGGARRNKPFIAINCGAIPENLIESELFGHKKGAFTGAVTDTIGLFRQAEGGTIFLDEIGDLPLALQTKLLRVLQEKTVRAVGDVRDIPIDVRIISATNKHLKQEVENKTFREDVYYRLNVVNIIMPPLRDRKDDIPLLISYFIGRICDVDEAIPSFSPEALNLLLSYRYPGNVRELENIIERALVLGGHAILPEHLAEEVAFFSKAEHLANHTPGVTQIMELPINLEGELERIERDYLLKALELSGGIKKQAAELLGLNFRSFRYRLKKYQSDENILGQSHENN